MFQAIASTLIYGKRDAVPVDTIMTVKQVDALVDWVAASGKNLTGYAAIELSSVFLAQISILYYGIKISSIT
jgi:hypothetical protein